MKKILASLLLLCIFWPSMAIAKNQAGITSEDFMEWLITCELKIPFLLSDYDERTLFAGSDGSGGAVIGYTFKDSDVLEAALAFGNESLLKIYFLSAISNETKTQSRVDETVNIVEVVQSNIVDAMNDDRTRPYSVNGYSVEFLYDESIGDVWLWINDLSKIETKMSVLTNIGAANFRVAEAVSLYQSERNAWAGTQKNAGATALSVGTYDCPAHIPSGEYKVTPQKGGNLFVRRDGSLVLNEVLYPDDGDEIGRLVLQDGDTIEIAGGGKFDFIPLQ